MKFVTPSLIILLLITISCNQVEKPLNETEKEQVKTEVMDTYKTQVEDLKRLDYNAMMAHYINNEDQVVFVDGKYWGGYETINNVWKDFCTNTDTIVYWNLSNHYVYPFSRDAATYLVEFDNLRIHHNGDTVMGPGSFAFGMQRINGSWKIATVHATHNYTKAPWLKN